MHRPYLVLMERNRQSWKEGNWVSALSFNFLICAMGIIKCNLRPHTHSRNFRWDVDIDTYYTHSLTQLFTQVEFAAFLKARALLVSHRVQGCSHVFKAYLRPKLTLHLIWPAQIHCQGRTSTGYQVGLWHCHLAVWLCKATRHGQNTQLALANSKRTYSHPSCSCVPPKHRTRRA